MAERPALRARRVAIGLTQAALARAARVSRQAYHAIENGRAEPSVAVALRLARALDTDVESIFAAPTEPTIRADEAPGVGPGSNRVALTRIDGRWIAYPLDGDASFASADGIVVARRRGVVDVAQAHPERATRNVVVVGCASALGVLADRVNRSLDPGRTSWFSRSSTASLEALARKRAHVAGVHLVDAKTGSANVADVHRIVPKEPLVLVTLARWEAGIVVAHKNPLGVRNLAEARHRGLRLVAREQGSGARRLFDREVGRSRATDDGGPRARATFLEVATPADVGRAIAIGAADAGIATRDVALAAGLGFVPLVEERFDLCTTTALAADPRVERLFDTMTSAPFRAELDALGYDAGPCGTRVSVPSAA